MSDTVRAAVQLGVRNMEVRELPMPEIGPDNGLVRIERSGLCGSDMEQYLGHFGGREMQPTIRGHEPLGIIEEVGERAAKRWGVKKGDRVAVEIVYSCRNCDLCLTGQYMFCRQGRFLHGYTPLETEPGIWGGNAAVHVPARELDRAQDAQRHRPGCRRHVQPARRRRALVRAAAADADGRIRAHPRSGPARADVRGRGEGGGREQHHRHGPRRATSASWRCARCWAPTTRSTPSTRTRSRR